MGEPGSPSGEATILGRAFTLGTVYAPVAHTRYPYDQRRLVPRRLVGHDPAYPWPEGRVEVETIPSATRRGSRTMRRWMSGRAWAAWAGEPVDDGPGDVGW